MRVSQKEAAKLAGVSVSTIRRHHVWSMISAVDMLQRDERGTYSYLDVSLYFAREKALRHQNSDVKVARLGDALGRAGSFERLDCMLYLLNGMPADVAARVFVSWWSMCDGTRDLLPFVRERLRDVDLVPHLPTDARAFYQALPERVTIYRGCSRDAVDDLSWTTDFAVAESFAEGRRIPVNDPVIATATVCKSDIAAAFVEREESEILLLTPPAEMEIAALQQKQAA